MKLHYLLFVILATGSFFGCTGQTKQKEFPVYLQENTSDCGPVCLKMIGEYYGIRYEINRLRQLSGTVDDTGTSLLGLSEAADSIGLKNLGVQL